MDADALCLPNSNMYETRARALTSMCACIQSAAFVFYSSSFLNRV